MLKMRICVYTHRRLKGIVIDCKRNVQQDTGYCTKKMSVHIFQVPRTLKSDVHLFAVLEKTTCRQCSILRSLMSQPTLRVPVLVCCTFNELRGTFWLSDLVFPGLSDALGLNDIENLFTVLISTSPHHVFEITGLPVVSWILNFCSLTLLRRHCLIG